MGMFRKKSDLSSGPDVPIDQVQAMKAQGYSNNQIIQSLQRDGYTSSQIFDAISQSEMSAGGNMNPSMNNAMQDPMGMPPMQSMQSMRPMEMQGPPQGMQGSGYAPDEMIETIIDEKWNELVKDINKVIEWKMKADTKLMQIEQKMTDLESQFDKLHQALLGKIGEYDKHILDVSTELQAMERAFSKVLPQFVDNVNELSRITSQVKSTNQPPKKTDKPLIQKPREE